MKGILKMANKRYQLNDPVPVLVGENLLGHIVEMEVAYSQQNKCDFLLMHVKDSDGGPPWCENVSLNLPRDMGKLDDGEFFVKNYSEGEYFYNALISHGILSETGATVPSGFVDIPICKFHGEEYERRVQSLEDEGLTRSDAQGVVDAEDLKKDLEDAGKRS